MQKRVWIKVIILEMFLIRYMKHRIIKKSSSHLSCLSVRTDVTFPPIWAAFSPTQTCFLPCGMLKAGFDVNVAQKENLSYPAWAFNRKRVAVVKQTGFFSPSALQRRSCSVWSGTAPFFTGWSADILRAQTAAFITALCDPLRFWGLFADSQI